MISQLAMFDDRRLDPFPFPFSAEAIGASRRSVRRSEEQLKVAMAGAAATAHRCWDLGVF